jgi:hypothetical protein
VVLVLAVDGLAFRACSPWPALSDSMEHWYYKSTIRDRLALEALAKDRNKKRHAVLLGTSRMKAAWRPKQLDLSLPDTLKVIRLAHARVFPPEIRAAAEALRDRAPDVVVLGLSEVDTHTPVRLDQRTTFPNSKVYFEAARHLGIRWLLAKRESLYRTLLGNVVRSYRHRDLLGEAGLDRLRRFPGTTVPSALPALDPVQAGVLAELEDVGTDVPADRERTRKLHEQILSLSGLRAGPHSAANLDFLRRSVEILREAGSDVVIIELPVHPAAQRLYDPRLRGEFLTLTTELEDNFAVRVIRLEDQDTFDASDFVDLTHVGAGGTEMTTHTILSTMLDTRS